MVYTLLEEQNKNRPQNIALICKCKEYSYRQLSNRIDFFTSLFHTNSNNDVIAIVLDRSIDMIAAVWAVLKSGNAYLPIDPSLPKVRIDYMLNDSNVRIVLTESKYEADYQTQLETVCLDKYNHTWHRKAKIIESAQHMSTIDCINELAYVMYTSGTTGKPKGVMISHGALVNYVQTMQEVYSLSFGERVLFKTPFNFDVSVREIIWTLAFGGTLVVSQPDGHKDPVYISEIIAKHNINLVHFVPSMLDVFLHHPLTNFADSVKCIICSGEAIQVQHVEAFFEQVPHARLLNMYGPTEAAVEVSIYDCSDFSGGKSVPIGKATKGNKLLIFNDQLELCKKNESGNLYIYGANLAAGYINNTTLTQQKFTTQNVEGMGTIRLYNTGDVVRRLPDGNIEFIGRKDEQVSINGYRIELNEISHIISAHQTVKSAYVTVWDGNTSTVKIVAYITVNELVDQTNISTEILTYLQSELPEYMIPNHIMVIEEMPLSANGKIAKNRLPEPVSFYNKEYLAPTNEIEEKLQALWAKNLKIERKISIDDNYFKLGGDSLSLINLIISINLEFDKSILLQELMGHETIKYMSKFIINQISVLSSKVERETCTWEEFEL